MKIKWNILLDIKAYFKAIIIKTFIIGVGINKSMRRMQKRSRNVSTSLEIWFMTEIALDSPQLSHTEGREQY